MLQSAVTVVYAVKIEPTNKYILVLQAEIVVLAEQTDPPNVAGPFPSDGSLLEFFHTDDALDVTWAHAVNSQQELKDALDSECYQ